ncbi:hypothetical protein AC1031_004417 [Aphanomyces cochlioides]|nr:hypothetical protein AC1031_004417 [Aphanomyces cochlioides]
MLDEDVVVKIAFFIAATDDLFAFLVSMRSVSLLGPLEHLWQLISAHPSAKLWPTLDLASLDLELPATKKAVEAIAKYYSCVSVKDFKDMPWLQAHLSPNVRLHWLIESSPSSIQHWNEWNAHRIADLSITSMFFNSSLLVKTLPQLKHMKSLEISSVFYDRSWLSHILAFAATSAHLECLQLLPTRYNDVTAAMVQDTMTWFNRQPVRVFCMSRWNWTFDDILLKQAFFNTIFSCPTLDRLDVLNMSFTEVDLSSVTLSMKTLRLFDCLTSSQMKTLSTRLQSSKVQNFEMSVQLDAFYDGFQHLLRHLHLCPSIQSLHLVVSSSYRYTWSEFIQFFELCQITSLTLLGGIFDSDALALLGDVVRSNLNIRRVEMEGWNLWGLSFDELMNFLDTTTMPQRALNIESIQIHRTNISRTEERSLLETAAARGVNLVIK